MIKKNMLNGDIAIEAQTPAGKREMLCIPLR
jgi:hypothetical protein